MRAKPTQAPRNTGPRGKQGLTRQRLLEVTLTLLQREGLAAISSTRIARDGGIAQPGFYAHFSSVEECVRVAVEHCLERLSTLVRSARQRVVQHTAKVEAGPQRMLASRELVHTSYAAAIDVLLSEPGLTEIVLRYRRDPSQIGAKIRESIGALRDELIGELWRRARRSGMHPEDYPRVAFCGEALWGQLLIGTEALLDDRFTDRNAIVDQLATHASAMLASRG